MLTILYNSSLIGEQAHHKLSVLLHSVLVALRHFKALLLLCSCLLFVAVAAMRFEVESHNVIFIASPPHSNVLKTTAKISHQTFVNLKIRLYRSSVAYQTCGLCFSTPDLSTHHPLMLQLQYRICLAKMLTITRSAQPVIYLAHVSGFQSLTYNIYDSLFRSSHIIIYT